MNEKVRHYNYKEHFIGKIIENFMEKERIELILE